ncbi:MAG: OmpA family protein [Polyangiaceae bacterium]
MATVAALSACSGAPPVVAAEARPEAGPRVEKERAPFGDRDRDGVANGVDQCPLIPEDRDEIDDGDGCPEEDADADGFPDTADACPKDPGFYSSDRRRNGCPPLFVDARPEVVSIPPTISFPSGDATTLTPADLASLDEVATVLKEHPEILKVEVQGDASADEPNGTSLAETRARTVRDALVARGVAADRLVVKGYGASRPLDDRPTDEARAKNRRASLRILEASL